MFGHILGYLIIGFIVILVFAAMDYGEEHDHSNPDFISHFKFGVKLGGILYGLITLLIIGFILLINGASITF